MYMYEVPSCWLMTCMCELTLLVRGADTGSTPPPICGCVLAVVGTGERALLRFNPHTPTHTKSRLPN